MDVERALITKALLEGIEPALEIPADWFLDRSSQRAWEWCLDYWRRHKTSPTEQAFRLDYPAYSMTKRDEPYSYVLEQFRERQRRNLLNDALIKSVDLLDAEDPVGSPTLKTLVPLKDAIAQTEAMMAKDILAHSIRSATWLDDQSFPEQRFVVPGVIPEGASLLAGSPKAGKSWLALTAAIAVASGSPMLGRIPVHQRPVLYLALEDGWSRLQRRSRRIIGDPDEPIPPALDFVIKVEPGRTVDLIAAWLAKHSDGLVLLDTLGKVLEPTKPGESAYERDYRISGGLKALVDAHTDSAITVLHHTRKATSSDFVDLVSGTNGVAGAFDTVLVLQSPRLQEIGTLMLTGRDVDENEYALRKADGGGWILDGESLTEASQVARERRQEEDLGDRMRTVIDFVNSRSEPVSAAEVALAIQLEPHTVRTYLGRAADAGHISRSGRGKYVRGVASVASVAFDDGDDHNATHATLATVPRRGVKRRSQMR
jgi:hypothetical protein